MRQLPSALGSASDTLGHPLGAQRPFLTVALVLERKVIVLEVGGAGVLFRLKIPVHSSFSQRDRKDGGRLRPIKLAKTSCDPNEYVPMVSNYGDQRCQVSSCNSFHESPDKRLKVKAVVTYSCKLQAVFFFVSCKLCFF